MWGRAFGPAAGLPAGAELRGCIGHPSALPSSMDKIPIPEQDVVPLERIAPGLTGLRILLVNLYAISRPAANGC